jgi:hypothetical protein
MGALENHDGAPWDLQNWLGASILARDECLQARFGDLPNCDSKQKCGQAFNSADNGLFDSTSLR